MRSSPCRPCCCWPTGSDESDHIKENNHAPQTCSSGDTRLNSSELGMVSPELVRPRQELEMVSPELAHPLVSLVSSTTKAWFFRRRWTSDPLCAWAWCDSGAQAVG